MSLDSIVEKNVLVLGLGVSGYAAAELAMRQGAHVTILDANGDNDDLQARAYRLSNRGAHVHLDWIEDTWNNPVDLAIMSPGIFPQSNLARLASKLSCLIISELEFGFNYCSCPILAITGTNGKTTTVELIVHCLKGGGFKALAAGNIGRPLSEVARKSSTLDYIVVEASSFQLERIANFTPLAGAILNISDDHLDRYHSYSEYIKTKLNLIKNMRQSKKVTVNYELLHKKEVKSCWPADMDGFTPVTFSSNHSMSDYYLNSEGAICFKAPKETIRLLDATDLKLLGNHSIENVEAALAVCQCIDIPHTITTPLVKTFTGRAHRQELIAVSNEVRYINDSKSTNPDALIQALITHGKICKNGEGNIILIAGGRNKNMNFSRTIPYIQRYVKETYLIGELRNHLAELWGQYTPCRKFTSIAAAVLDAVENSTLGDVVLFSPGAASQDMFTNYEERGNIFSNEVRRRIEK